METMDRRTFIKWGAVGAVLGPIAAALGRFLPPPEESDPRMPTLAPTPTGPDQRPTPEEKRTFASGDEMLRYHGLQSEKEGRREPNYGHVVYGRLGSEERPSAGWGTLGKAVSPEEAWIFADEVKRKTITALGCPAEKFALDILNPVTSPADFEKPEKIKFLRGALEIALQRNGVVALNFETIDQIHGAFKALDKLVKDGSLPAYLLPYAGFSLDTEWNTVNKDIPAETINAVAREFADKHKEWTKNIPARRSADRRPVPPGVFLVYSVHGADGLGRIANLQKLQTYYLDADTMAVVVFDGFGPVAAKKYKLDQIGGAQPHQPGSDPIPAAMSFFSRKEDYLHSFLVNIGRVTRLLTGQLINSPAYDELAKKRTRLEANLAQIKDEIPIYDTFKLIESNPGDPGKPAPALFLGHQ